MKVLLPLPFLLAIACQSDCSKDSQGCQEFQVQTEICSFLGCHIKNVTFCRFNGRLFSAEENLGNFNVTLHQFNSTLMEGASKIETLEIGVDSFNVTLMQFNSTLMVETGKIETLETQAAALNVGLLNVTGELGNVSIALDSLNGSLLEKIDSVDSAFKDGLAEAKENWNVHLDDVKTELKNVSQAFEKHLKTEIETVKEGCQIAIDDSIKVMRDEIKNVKKESDMVNMILVIAFIVGFGFLFRRLERLIHDNRTTMERVISNNRTYLEEANAINRAFLESLLLRFVGSNNHFDANRLDGNGMEVQEADPQNVPILQDAEEHPLGHLPADGIEGPLVAGAVEQPLMDLPTGDDNDEQEIFQDAEEPPLGDLPAEVVEQPFVALPTGAVDQPLPTGDMIDNITYEEMISTHNALVARLDLDSDEESVDEELAAPPPTVTPPPNITDNGEKKPVWNDARQMWIGGDGEILEVTSLEVTPLVDSSDDDTSDDFTSIAD